MRESGQKISILFVCHSNICRSPMAEFAMKDMVREKGIDDDFFIASAATTTAEIWGGRGEPVYPPAVQELKRHGIGVRGNDFGVSQKRATLMVKEDYCRYDFLIGMDEENRYDMKRICRGDPNGKISLLLDFTNHPRSVADPWYTGDFAATWNDVTKGCEALIAFLQKQKRLPPF